MLRLPTGAVLLASSPRVTHQAFTFPGKPIYCTQFHPELQKCDLLERLEAYPEYIEKIAGVTPEQFNAGCVETPEANHLIARFVQQVVDAAAGDIRLG